MNVEKIRQDFPILKRKVHGKPLVYLDNAATSQKPLQVIEAMSRYYKEYNANVHRGLHKLSEEATLAFENAHKRAAKFIGARSMEEIILTKNTTESLNLLAYTLPIEKDDEIVLSRMEHHSNLVPWQQIAKKKGASLKFIELTKDGCLDMDSAEKVIGKKTKIVSLMHVSNVLGTINDVKELGKIAHDNDAVFVVDGAQSVPHIPIDVRKIDCDFLAFSGHKMLGPMGSGVLFGKKNMLEETEPFLFGGGMILEVSYDKTTWNELPWKFEAGTPSIAEAIGLAAAMDYLSKLGMKNIQKHEQRLARHAFESMQEIGATIYGPRPDARCGVISFNMGNIHAHDLSTVLDQEGIAIRGGHHCAMPLMKHLGLTSTARASFYLYNTAEEIDFFIEVLKRAKHVFEGV